MGKLNINFGSVSNFKSGFEKISKTIKGGGDMDLNSFTKESGINIPSESDLKSGNVNISDDISKDLNMDEFKDLTSEDITKKFGI